MAAAARQLLAASTLCAIATVTPSGRAYVNTAYFAWTRDYDIVWLSAPRGHWVEDAIVCDVECGETHRQRAAKHGAMAARGSSRLAPLEVWSTGSPRSSPPRSKVFEKPRVDQGDVSHSDGAENIGSAFWRP